MQVVHNAKYNPVPGRRIENITFRNIRCDCIPPVDSMIAGFDDEHCVTDIILENVTACGEPARVQVGKYVGRVIRKP